MVTRAASIVLLAFVAACGSATSGSAGGGSQPRVPESPHPQDMGFMEGQKYERNPDVKLAREYWIIGVAEDGTRFMFPRPDGDPRIVEECRKNGPLAPLFEGAFLCNTATPNTLSRVNALTESEARQVSTFLHERLRFVVTESAQAGPNVEPYALHSDLLDICKAHPDDRNGVMKATCDHLLGNEASSSGAPEIGHAFSLEECRVIATRLNELYGIR